MEKVYKSLEKFKKKREQDAIKEKLRIQKSRCSCTSIVKCKNCQTKRYKKLMLEKQITLKQKQRTINQNKSIHKWFDEIASECRDKGITIKVLLDVFKNEGIYPDKETIKLLFQVVAKAMFEKSKTSELTTAELTKTAEQFTVAMAKSGIETPFPSIEQMDNYLESYEYRG